jgi:hypothetical protein
MPNDLGPPAISPNVPDFGDAGIPAIKGQGAASNPEGRFGSASRSLDDLTNRPKPCTQVMEEQTKGAISRNESPDIPFSRSVNPYRGCEHGCVYCFARPSADSTGGGRNPSRNFSGQKRSNETHQSRTDGDAKLYRKGVGKESRLCYMGHALMENDAGLVVRTQLTEASGTAEREAALKMIRQVKPPSRRVSLGGDKGFDAKDFIGDLRKIKVTPHIAPNDYVTKTGKRRHSSIDRRTTRHPGFTRSQRTRKRIEEVFGWIKQSAGLRQTKFGRQSPRRRPVHLRRPRLQSGQTAKAAGSNLMTALTILPQRPFHAEIDRKSNAHHHSVCASHSKSPRLTHHRPENLLTL